MVPLTGMTLRSVFGIVWCSSQWYSRWRSQFGSCVFVKALLARQHLRRDPDEIAVLLDQSPQTHLTCHKSKQATRELKYIIKVFQQNTQTESVTPTSIEECQKFFVNMCEWMQLKLRDAKQSELADGPPQKRWRDTCRVTDLGIAGFYKKVLELTSTTRTCLTVKITK